MTIRAIDVDEHVGVVVIRGELCGATAPIVASAFQSAVDTGAVEVRVDTTEVRRCTEAGSRLLTAARERLE